MAALKKKKKTLQGLVKTHTGTKTLSSFLSVFFLSASRCPRVIRYWSGLLNGPLCSPSPYRVTFDLFGQRDQQRLQGEESQETPKSEQSKAGTIHSERHYMKYF